MDARVVHKEKRVEIRSHMEKVYGREIEKDTFRGLTSEKKFLHSKYFYDARGSRLFEEICRLPEYYPTRTEMSILKDAAPDIMSSFSGGDLVELGSGANWKIRLLLDALDKELLPAVRYVPVDVSEAALREASEGLLEVYPELAVLGIVADFTMHVDVIPDDRPRLIFFLGSTIGNFREDEQERFIKLVSGSMKQGDRFFVGFDMLKPRTALETAYNDNRGVTSEFNKNILNVLNRELNADFDPGHFEHMAFFNENKERVEMHLRAKKKVEVAIDDLDIVVELDKDETIHTEVCGKFSRGRVKTIAAAAGLEIKNWYSDRKDWFAIAEMALKE